ncbi:TPA: hypothetical protein P1H65_002910, partial [Staphylococcus aureus]|nr:hypothetical protein [Staphylococcus aureus]
MLKKSIASTFAALSLLAVAPVAHAADFGGDFELPQRWNEDHKPGTHCSTPGENGTYVTTTRRWFKQTDATSVANRNDEPVPVSHTVTQARTQTIEVSGSIKGVGE